MATLQRIPMSWEEYLDLPEKPKAEWVDGVAVVSPPAHADHMDASFCLTALLRRSLTGCKVYLEVGVSLPRNRLRVPDVVALPHRPEKHWAEEVPILVAEVLSPTTQSEDLLRKAPEYAEAGIGQFWVLDPDHRTLEVFELVAGAWEPLLRLDDTRPTGEVSVEGHGVVPLDLAGILEG